MAQYILRRLVITIPVLFGAATAVFFMANLLPGDILRAMLTGTDIDPEQVEAIREQLGLNDPILVRYLRFMGDLVQGDLGRSTLSQRPVLTQIMEQLPNTLRLAFTAMSVASMLGVTLGVIAAVKHQTWIDRSAMLGAVAAIGFPDFFFAMLLIMLFSVELGWFPATGQGGVAAIILPATALGARAAAILARLTRSSMLEVMRMDYIATARSKGLTQRAVIVKHALRNALIPVVTTMGVQLGNLIAGTIVIETVFARRGSGSLLVGAIFAKDQPLIQGAILITAMMYVLINLVIDLIYPLLDPRIKLNR